MFSPHLVGQVVQLPAGRYRHEQRGRLLVDSEFGYPHRIRDHLD